MVPIEPPTTARTDATFRRWGASIALCLLAVLVLTACGGGTAQESHLAQERDSTKGAVVPGLQATKIVKDYFPTPGTPAPTMTPRATIASLVLATQVQSTGEPISRVTRAGPGQAIYVVAQLSHLRTGETVTAKWFNSSGAQLGEVNQPVNSDMDSAWVALPWTVDGSAFGNCWVEVWVNDTMMNSLVFNAG